MKFSAFLAPLTTKHFGAESQCPIEASRLLLILMGSNWATSSASNCASPPAVDQGSSPDLQRAKAFKQLRARRSEDLSVKSVLGLLGLTQQCFNCTFSLFPTQAGKEELKCVSQALPCQWQSSKDLAFQKLSGSFGVTKKHWGTSTPSPSLAHHNVLHEESISSFLHPTLGQEKHLRLRQLPKEPPSCCQGPAHTQVFVSALKI